MKKYGVFLNYRNAIIIHGKPSREKYYSPDYPSSSNFAWIPWLQKHLIINDIKADTPEMPLAYEPDYKVWKREFERFDICQNTSLIGHSAGGTFILRWLSENANLKVDQVALVAPSYHSRDNSFVDFLDFSIESSIAEQVSRLTLFTSDNDSELSKKNITTIKKQIPSAIVVELPGRGHFTPEDMGRVDFPELLSIILEEK